MWFLNHLICPTRADTTFLHGKNKHENTLWFFLMWYYFKIDACPFLSIDFFRDLIQRLPFCFSPSPPGKKHTHTHKTFIFLLISLLLNCQYFSLFSHQRMIFCPGFKFRFSFYSRLLHLGIIILCKNHTDMFKICCKIGWISNLEICWNLSPRFVQFMTLP